MSKLPHRLEADGDLAPWETELGQRLASLADLPIPPSLAPEATEQFIQRLWAQPARIPTAARRPAPIRTIGMRFAALLIACLLGLSGVGYATATSLPGDPLYGLKRQVETAQLAVSPAEQQPGLAETLVDRRLAEVAQLVGQHASAARVDAGVAEYAAATIAFGHAPAAPEKELLFQRHLAMLAQLEALAPAQNRTALQTVQRAAQVQLENEEQAAPEPTLETPRVRPTPMPVNSTPSVSPSAMMTPVVPTASRPSMKEPTGSAAQPAAKPPAATAEVLPSATPPAVTAVPKVPEHASTATTPAASTKPAPAHRASPQPTRNAPSQHPSNAPRETQQSGDAHSQTPAPTPDQPRDNPGQVASPTPDRPGDPPASGAPPAGATSAPEQPGAPHNPGAPSPEATSAPRSEQPSAEPDRPNQPSPQRDPPSNPAPNKTQATDSKPGSSGSQHDPPASGGTHQHPPGQPGKP